MNSLQDIMNLHGDAYISSNKLPSNILKALYSIRDCRTVALGGHVYECDECGETVISYNSCRNRHCPRCQAYAKEMWIYERSKALLPTHYFHIVFTIPEQLNSLTLFNQKEMYSILFTSVSETLLELAKDKKYLHANTGFTTILHTWGQNLMFHPHIHCIVPGGGLSLDNTRWIRSKKKFFIPVKVLSRIFRVKPKEFENLSSAELFFKLTGIKIGKCKNCEKGNLIKIGKIMPWSTSPP